MFLTILTDKREYEPGFLSISKKSFGNIFRNNFKSGNKKNSILNIFRVINSNYLSTVAMNSGIEYFQQQKELLFKNVQKGQLPDSIAEVATVVTKEQILANNLKYNSKNQDGLNICNCFIHNSTQFNAIIQSLPSNDSFVLILPRNELNKLLNKDYSSTGLYFFEKDNLFKHNNYSNDKWEVLKQGIISVFSNLGATKLSIIDKTLSTKEVDISLNKKFLKIAPKLGVKTNRSTSFEIQMTLNGGKNIKNAQNYLYQLQSFPSLMTIADNAINNPGNTKSIKTIIKLDLSFGMNLDLLLYCQGSFQGGYTRDFEFEAEFI